MIRIVRNTKFTILLLILIFSAFFALKALIDILVTNEYSKSLTAKSLKLQSNKVYLFTTKNVVSKSKDTLNIPIENKSFPDSLCYLYYDKEWKLGLTNQLRNNHTESVTNPLFPWCCTQEPNPDFFSKGISINEKVLIDKGIKFNYYSGLPSDRFSLKLDKHDTDYFLNANLSFLGNTYPINVKQDNVFEVNYCNYTDTIPSKFVFLFPFFQNGKPSRGVLNIQTTSINYINQTSNQTTGFAEPSFEINNIRFELKDNYGRNVFYTILFLYFFIVVTSFYNIYRLFRLYHKLPHRNLIVSEQSYILTLRLLFNCIVFLGFPLLLIKLRFSPNRLIPYSLLILFLNVNWIWLYQYISKSKANQYLSSFKKYSFKIKPVILLRKHILLPLFNFISKNSSNFILFFIISIICLIKLKGNNSESLFGIPVLHITKLLYVLLPFTLTNTLIKKIGTIKYVTKYRLNIAYFLTVFISLVIGYVSKDFATPIFTFLALFLIMLLQKDNLVDSVKYFFRTYKYHLAFMLIILLTLYNFIPNVDSWAHSKVYRLLSTYKLPNNSTLQNVDEQAKQTIAQQLYLLKSSFGSFDLIPNFNQVILPSWKSTFFSDYAVLWSFKIGSYPFLVVYFLILLFISYSIISLLIILNKKIPLHNGKMVFYNKKMVLIFNVLLSLFLIQYIYTFLSNIWLLPLTGQSPGVLCPSYFELGFHIILINSLYLFIEKKQIVDLPDRRPVVYTKVKRNSSFFILVLFAASIFGIAWQIGRIASLDNEMRWQTNNQVDKPFYVSNIDSLEFFAREAIYEKDKIKFKLCHQKFYKSEDIVSDSFLVSKSFIDNCSNIDSLYYLKITPIQTNDNDLVYYNKSINYKATDAISNIYYSGCPVKAKSINFDLQKELNFALLSWASKINADRVNKHQMVSGCVIVAKNDGKLMATSSYPLLFNENRYHLKYIEDSINSNFDFKFKYYTINDYVNSSEYDQMPGSIVKPLLAYCGLKLLPQSNKNISGKSLNYFIGYSDPKIATNIFKQFITLNEIDTLKHLYKQDFSINQFYDLKSGYNLPNDDKTLKSYAIGQQNKLTFKDIVQAYTRIKTGKKIVFTYNIPDTTKHFEDISLTDEKLKVLKTAMKYPLRNGTAANVGRELKNKNINYSNFLAKTGTAQIANDPNHNKTSSFIIVTDDYTIGIQFYGDLPKNESLGGCSARHLFIKIINILTKYDILQKQHK